MYNTWVFVTRRLTRSSKIKYLPFWWNLWKAFVCGNMFCKSKREERRYHGTDRLKNGDDESFISAILPLLLRRSSLFCEIQTQPHRAKRNKPDFLTPYAENWFHDDCSSSCYSFRSILNRVLNKILPWLKSCTALSAPMCSYGLVKRFLRSFFAVWRANFRPLWRAQEYSSDIKGDLRHR